MICFNLKAEAVKYQTNLLHQSEMCNISWCLMKSCSKNVNSFSIGVEQDCGNSLQQEMANFMQRRKWKVCVYQTVLTACSVLKKKLQLPLKWCSYKYTNIWCLNFISACVYFSTSNLALILYTTCHGSQWMSCFLSAVQENQHSAFDTLVPIIVIPVNTFMHYNCVKTRFLKNTI